MQALSHPDFATDFHMLVALTEWNLEALSMVPRTVRGSKRWVGRAQSQAGPSGLYHSLQQDAQLQEWKIYELQSSRLWDSTHKEPMQVGRTRLTPADCFQQMRAGLCLYCKGMGQRAGNVQTGGRISLFSGEQKKCTSQCLCSAYAHTNLTWCSIPFMLTTINLSEPPVKLGS